MINAYALLCMTSKLQLQRLTNWPTWDVMSNLDFSFSYCFCFHHYPISPEINILLRIAKCIMLLKENHIYALIIMIGSINHNQFNSLNA